MTLLRKFVDSLDYWSLSKIKNSSKLTALYYLWNSYGFSDEQKAVVAGRLANEGGQSLADHRRAIHRIEKGLITTPRRQVFATSFIYKTVLTHLDLTKRSENKELVDWGERVLNEYFAVAKGHEQIELARSIYKAQNDQTTSTYSYSELPPLTVTYEEFFQLNRRRRSVRYYKDEKVPRQLIVNAFELALQAPSACNRQPFSVRVIDDCELLKKAVLLPAGVRSFGHNIQALAFVIGDLSAYFDERDKHLIYIDGSLFTMNAILAMETLGLSSCVINWGDRPERNRKMARLLNLENYERCILCISIGYGKNDGGIPRSQKKNVKEVIKFN